MSHTYTTFNPVNNDQLKEPMFFGNPVNVARYDQQKHAIFETITEKQISFFWRPEEVDVSKDKIDFESLSDAEKHVFVYNLKYQILLDSVQGRSPNIAFLPIVSIPELETFIETWSFFETIHSRSYTHIIRNLFNDPSSVFNTIVDDEEIKKRAVDVSKYYDALIVACKYRETMGDGVHKCRETGAKIDSTIRGLKKALFLCMVSVNALESVRFYVSFCCSFSFAERRKMEGNAKIIRFIARDESLHMTATQHIINLWRSGRDDPEMKEIFDECKEEAYSIYRDAILQEKEWAKFLFSKGSFMGLNEQILSEYVDYIAHNRMSVIGLNPDFDCPSSNPVPWVNSYLKSDNVQVAPQESEISSYLTGQIESKVDSDDFADFEL